MERPNCLFIKGHKIKYNKNMFQISINTDIMQEKVTNWCEVVGNEEAIYFSGYTTVELDCRQQFSQK